MISDGYTFLPAGKLAAVVTYLEITEFPTLPSPSAPPGFVLQLAEKPDLHWYRSLFRKVGEPWLWFSRLRMEDEELRGILHHESVDVFALLRDDKPVGLLELDGRVPGEMELAYLGLASEAIGQGAGRFLMQVAITRAMEKLVRRFWVHTCTLDHPDALRIYIRAGFRPYKRAIEVFDDPRLTGHLPREAAPQIPLLEH